MARLLLVDDEAGLRRGLAAYLRTQGWQVAEASGLAEAREQVDLARPQVVITDQCMGDGQGTDLAAWLAEESPGTRVVVVTGYADRRLLAGTLPPGVDLVMEKPVRPRELLQAIATLLPEADPTGQGDDRTAAWQGSETARRQRELRASLWGEE